ncbi:hypothetical protein [Leptospira perdikensis]|uniref:Uncharacterized protein n=1 Tax=Leptospira perdikensis TaxID=2484948 RepID=A0A4R9JHE1_9LEPT|nr:hypothetical protein [Leptospira perdikensis]TGL39167.1 hypothetical protein EHQ49_12480 [Leptospira perdikensis]
MIINIETHLASNFERITSYAKLSKTLHYIAKPLIVFEPVNQISFPENWENGEYLTDMKLFGIIPLGNQSVVIEKIKETNQNEFILRDNGYSSLINTWDHWILIRKTKHENLVTYIDRIEIKAGLLTVFIVIFASVFFRWRQFRWKLLIRNNFKALY